MMITTAEFKAQENFILSYIPLRLKSVLFECISEKTEEIRLRAKMPLSVKDNSHLYFVTKNGRLSKNFQNALIVTKSDIEIATDLLFSSSVYAYEEEIKKGYITTSSGHRVGICGNAVYENGKVSFINNISGLNFRIAHEIKGIADKLTQDIFNNNSVRNTLIISPPGSGKTTLLRDLARVISNKGKNVCILDERGEIAAMHNGVPMFDIGFFTDVLSGFKKSEGITLSLKSMAPDVIITDELCDEEDFKALKEASKKGVSVIATMHAKNTRDIKESIIDCFDCIITLSTRCGVGTIEEILVR